MTARFAFAGLSSGYGGTTILRGLGAAVAAGEVLFVLGRNGVGKSTLMKTLMGFLPAAEGAVTLDGADITHRAPPERRALGISYCPQERVVFDELSVRNNLMLMAPPEAPQRLAALADRFPLLAERADQRAGTLSGGEKKILSFVRGTIENHGVFLLDEPTEGVQPENIERMEADPRAEELPASPSVVVEQNLNLAERLADRRIVLDKGQIVFEAGKVSIAMRC
ncbi:MAG: ATP-binding cassette domain-containing protein [Rhodospirillaceae bacterium]|nr:ATP-binding cassette domain-containing protein [Rhodospirillaceae bacterium]